MNQLQKYDASSLGFDKETISLIKEKIAVGATDAELFMFLQQCKRTGLDAFSKQIYCISRWDSRLGRNAATTQISIDGARLVAERSGKYAGQVGPFWCGEDGEWKDVWLKQEPPRAAKVGVHREGFKEPLFAVANWDAYAQTDKSGKVTKMWSQFSALMLGKVAEMLALRRAFPMELSGLYSSEEMSQADVVDVVPAPVTKQATQANAVIESLNSAVQYYSDAKKPILFRWLSDQGIMFKNVEEKELGAVLHQTLCKSALNMEDSKIMVIDAVNVFKGKQNEPKN